MIEINGVAHTFICSGDFERARAFYSKLLPFLGLKVVGDAPGLYYCVGGRTGFGIEAARPEHRGKRFEQGTVGLHHHCWRARSREDVDKVQAFLVEIGAHIVHGTQEDAFAPGYYSVLFEDPDGTRLEVNHVPGVGLFAPGTRLGGYDNGTPND